MTKLSLDKRKYGHFKSIHTGRCDCAVFHHAVRKYGWGAFEWSIIFQSKSIDALMAVERAIIVELNTIHPHGYNMTSGGDGIFRPSDELRKKMSESGKKRPPMSAETKAKLSATNKRNGHRPPLMTGIPRSDEIRKKISTALMGHSLSDETRKKISETLKRRNANGEIIIVRKPKTAEQRQACGDRTRGKTYEDLYGHEKSTEIKAKQRKRYE